MEERDRFEFSTTKWRAGFLRATLILACVFGLVLLIPAVLTATPALKSVFIGIYALLLVVTLLPAGVNIKAAALVGILAVLSLLNLAGIAAYGDGRDFMLAAIALAAIMISWRAGWAMVGLAFVTYAVFGWLALSNHPFTANLPLAPASLGDWVARFLGTILVSILIVNGVRLTQNEYEQSRSQAHTLYNTISQERKNLEARVQERTEILEKRTAQLRSVADVGKSVTSYRDLSELLQQAASLIHENFGYYHVGIFLLDDRKEFAVLTATNSEGGKRMLDKRHVLKVGETGIVGYVAASLQARIALDVGADAVFFNHPDLPNTRSEMALPLVAGGQILGVLDAQSAEPSAFAEDDIATLQILAEQLAIAIQNAKLFSDTAKALESARATYGQLSREAWSKMLRSQSGIGFLATPPATTQIKSDPLPPSIAKAIETGDLILGSDGLTISVPVKIRGQVIGAVRLKKPDIAEAWTQEESNLAISLADQLSGALESARLYRDSLQRASRESLVSDISGRITAASTRGAILRETVLELGQALGNTSVSFHLLNPADGAKQARDGVRTARNPLGREPADES
jgi:GAF domain-containing protein